MNKIKVTQTPGWPETIIETWPKSKEEKDIIVRKVKTLVYNAAISEHSILVEYECEVPSIGRELFWTKEFQKYVQRIKELLSVGRTEDGQQITNFATNNNICNVCSGLTDAVKPSEGANN